MLEIDYEYETPIVSNYYKNDFHKTNLKGPDNNQIPTSYTQHINETNSNMNRIKQNTTIKASPSKEQIWTIPLLLERPKNKSFQPLDLEIVS